MLIHNPKHVVAPTKSNGVALSLKPGVAEID
jgi:hypothetical protein